MPQHDNTEPLRIGILPSDLLDALITELGFHYPTRVYTQFVTDDSAGSITLTDRFIDLDLVEGNRDYLMRIDRGLPASVIVATIRAALDAHRAQSSI